MWKDDGMAEREWVGRWMGLGKLDGGFMDDRVDGEVIVRGRAVNAWRDEWGDRWMVGDQCMMPDWLWLMEGKGMVGPLASGCPGG